MALEGTEDPVWLDMGVHMWVFLNRGTEEVEGNAQREGEEEETAVQDVRQTNSTENNAHAPCQVKTVYQRPTHTHTQTVHLCDHRSNII